MKKIFKCIENEYGYELDELTVDKHGIEYLKLSKMTNDDKRIIIEVYYYRHGNLIKNKYIEEKNLNRIGSKLRGYEIEIIKSVYNAYEQI